MNYFMFLLISEIIIFTVETLIFVKLLALEDTRKVVKYTLTANAVSLVIGFIALLLTGRIPI